MSQFLALDLRQSFAVTWPLKLFKATFKTYIINIIIINIFTIFFFGGEY